MEPKRTRLRLGLVGQSVLALAAACNAPFFAKPACPLPDEGLCDFVREIEGILEAADGQALMRRTEAGCNLRDFRQPGMEEDGAIPDAAGVFGGLFFAESNCMPIEGYVQAWSESGAKVVRYVIYPRLEESRRDGPALLIRTDDPEFDRLLFLERSGSEWRIIAAPGVRKSVETTLSNRIGWSDSQIEWNGMLADPEEWVIVPGSLTHRSLEGCRLTVSDHPISESTDPPVKTETWGDLGYLAYEGSAVEGRARVRYYTLVRASGEALSPLGYLRVEGDDLPACAAQAERLLSTLDPDYFPEFLRFLPP